MYPANLAWAWSKLGHTVELYAPPGSMVPENGALCECPWSRTYWPHLIEEQIYFSYQDRLKQADVVADMSHTHRIAGLLREQGYDRVVSTHFGHVWLAPWEPYNMVTGCRAWHDASAAGVDEWGHTEEAFRKWESVVIPWACFPPGTFVRTPGGDKPIEDIESGDTVLGIDQQGRSLESTVLVTMSHVYSGEFRELSVGDKTVMATANHPFFVKNRGWVPAHRVVEGDIIATERDNTIYTSLLPLMKATHGKWTQLENRGYSDTKRTLSHRSALWGDHRTNGLAAKRERDSTQSRFSQTKTQDEAIPPWKAATMAHVDQGRERASPCIMDNQLQARSPYPVPRPYMVISHGENGHNRQRQKQVLLLRCPSQNAVNANRGRLYSGDCGWRRLHFTWDKVSEEMGHSQTTSFSVQHLCRNARLFEPQDTVHIHRRTQEWSSGQKNLLGWTGWRVQSPPTAECDSSLPYSEATASRIAPEVPVAENYAPKGILHRGRDRHILQPKKIKWQTVNRIRTVYAKAKVYNLSTETHNYIANGFLVHNCDTQLYHPTDYVKRPYCFWLCRIRPEKGIAQYLDVAARHPATTFLFSGSLEFPDHKAMGKEYVLRARGMSNVEFVSIPVTPLHQVLKARLLREAAVMIANPHGEAFGLYIIEALASGTPVIGRAVGSLPEIIEHGKTGFLFHDDRELDWALEHIGEIDPTRCREEALVRFDRMRAAEEYILLFKDVIAGRRW